MGQSMLVLKRQEKTCQCKLWKRKTRVVCNTGGARPEELSPAASQ